jgi:hypothetical protein
LIWRNTLLTPLILIGISGCVTGSTPPLNNSYCTISKPITYNSRADSAPTVAQIEAHNSQWVCLCEEDCPAKP